MEEEGEDRALQILAARTSMRKPDERARLRLCSRIGGTLKEKDP